MSKLASNFQKISEKCEAIGNNLDKNLKKTSITY